MKPIGKFLWKKVGIIAFCNQKNILKKRIRNVLFRILAPQKS